MLHKIRNLFCSSCTPFGTGPKCEDCEDFEHIGVSRQIGIWAKKNGSGVSPEEIMTAAIVQSIVAHFDQWEVSGFTDPQIAWNISGQGILKHKEKNIILSRTAQRKNQKYRFNGMKINGEEIPLKYEKMIVAAYEKISAKIKAAEEAAKTASATMSRNEKAWNLVEELLNLKRDDNGALVPKETTE